VVDFAGRLMFRVSDPGREGRERPELKPPNWNVAHVPHRVILSKPDLPYPNLYSKYGEFYFTRSELLGSELGPSKPARRPPDVDPFWT